METILVIAAMGFEANRIAAALDSAVHHSGSPFPLVTGTFNGRSVAVCTGGVGKVNSAAATAVMIERLNPRLVMNTGCAGAYHGSGLCVGDLAVATSEYLGDEGAVTSAGWIGLQEMNLAYLKCDTSSYFNEIPLSAPATNFLSEFASREQITLKSGRFVTVSSCSGSLESGEMLARRCNGIAENMEGAAVALTCLRYDIDCVEIRGISNMVEERNLENWNIRLAVDKAQDFLLRYLNSL